MKNVKIQTMGLSQNDSDERSEFRKFKNVGVGISCELTPKKEKKENKIKQKDLSMLRSFIIHQQKSESNQTSYQSCEHWEGEDLWEVPEQMRKPQFSGKYRSKIILHSARRMNDSSSLQMSGKDISIDVSIADHVSRPSNKLQLWSSKRIEKDKEEFTQSGSMAKNQNGGTLKQEQDDPFLMIKQSVEYQIMRRQKELLIKYLVHVNGMIPHRSKAASQLLNRDSSFSQISTFRKGFC